MKTVCMIPARGNSKRIPQKNIKDFLGKPIITYPIETAKTSGIFDEIIVYTDDENIKQVAYENSIFSMNRKTIDDYETLTQTILNFIDDFGKWQIPHDQAWIDYLCILLPTAVFVKSEYINLINGIGGNDAIITFCKYSHPIERAFWPIYTNGMAMINSQYEFARTQDLEEKYYDAGQMYFLNVKSFLEQKRIFMKNIYPIIINAVDIDNPEDWKKAEAFYKIQKELV